jgi:hypothetical protein
MMLNDMRLIPTDYLWALLNAFKEGHTKESRAKSFRRLMDIIEKK